MPRVPRAPRFHVFVDTTSPLVERAGFTNKRNAIRFLRAQLKLKHNAIAEGIAKATLRAREILKPRLIRGEVRMGADYTKAALLTQLHITPDGVIVEEEL